MALTTCPSKVAHCPPGAVWALLADPRAYREWIDAHVESITPEGPAVPGQRILVRAPKWGRWFAVHIAVVTADAVNHVLELTTQFPFGLRLENRLAVEPLDASTSKVWFG